MNPAVDQSDFHVAVAKVVPPAAVTVAQTVMGIPVADWVSYATLIYVGLQAYVLVRDKIVKHGRRKQ